MTIENFITALAWVFGVLGAIVTVGDIYYASQGEKVKPCSGSANVLMVLSWAWLLARYCL